MPPAIDKLRNMKIDIRGEDYVLDDEYDTLDGDPTIKQGDLVLDLKDGSFGWVKEKVTDELGNETLSLRDRFFIEVGVPLSRVVKLKKADSA